MIYWILIVTALILLGLARSYNKLIRARNFVKEAFSGIDVQLKKRYDLLPNLVETVKGYAKHESETLENVIRMRDGAGTVQDAVKSDTQVSQALINIRNLTENYPELKADKNFIILMTDLNEIEGDLESARRYYNGTVRDYNDRTMVIPVNLIAGHFGFKQEPFYEIEDTIERKAPQIKF